MTRSAHSPLRVLMPYRLDVFARAMDSTIATMWLELRHVCDAHFWGPGFPGYDPTITFDEAVARVAPDVVLLPDLHHAIPGLWTELLDGVERISSCPVVQFMSDPSSAVEQRRAQVERIRPDAVLGLGPERAYAEYKPLLQRLGTKLLTRPLGQDPNLFYLDDDDAPERDIDVLVCGAVAGTAYPVRERTQQAARMLASEWSIADLAHPGYWECLPAARARHGQAAFAHLLRRSRLVVTGTTYGIMSAKYYEAAACGAVGIGDLPDQPAADDLRGAMVVIDPADDPSSIARTVAEVLRDDDRLATMRAAGLEAARTSDVRERARRTVRLLEGLVAPGGTSSRVGARPAQVLEAPICICAPADDDAPAPRRDWHVVRGPRRTERLRALLEASTATQCVLAFHVDAASPAEALLLAQAARDRGGLAWRAARISIAPIEAGFTTIAVDRELLLADLRPADGMAGIEAAVWRLLSSLPEERVPWTGLDDPQARALRVEGALLAGVQDAPRVSDPELVTHIAGARFAVLDPSDDASLARICELARAGIGARPLELAVPARCGTTLAEAATCLQQRLDAERIDLDRCADLVILERPLHEPELRWLEHELAS